MLINYPSKNFTCIQLSENFIRNYLSDAISNYEITYKMHPQVPNVQLMNQCEELFRTRGNKFISLSSNNTYFGTLTNDNEVVIQQWENLIIQQVGQSVHIESSFNCFNINLSKDFSILIDCYYNDEFILIQLIDAQSKIAYSIQSTIPTSTKIQSIVNRTDTFVVYAQYFGEYSITFLFSSQFYNLSSLQNKNFSILIFQLQQVRIYMQLLIKRSSSYPYLQIFNFIIKIILARMI